MKITNDEIAELKDYNRHCEFYDMVAESDAALDRLAELEEAVAWHGFDELPESGKMIECKDDTGRLKTFFFGGAGIGFLMNKLLKEFEGMGFIGWRYPVGDLS